MKDNKIYLKHIRDSIDDVLDAIKGISYEEFSNNKILLKAVVRDCEIIGEASNKLETGFRETNSQIAWRDYIDMRNEMIHEYFGVNPEEVWKTCQKDLPELKKEIEKLLMK